MAELRFAFTERGLALRVTGGALAGRFDAQADVFVDDDAATAPEKIMVHQDLPETEVVMHGWIKQGVLVLAIFRKFKGGSGRSNYFDREFFFRADGPR
jgi:hypothetical protein